MTFEQIYEPQMKETVVRKILEALPDWFEMEEGREQYIKESAEQICIGAAKDTEFVGFLCLKETGKDTLELAVMGVLKEYHRQGIGRGMFMMAKNIAREKGYSFLQVKTVQMGKYEDYDDTNRFYISLGFKEFEVFPTLWDEAIEKFTGKIIAVVHRNDDVEEKWVVAPAGMTFTKEEIREQIHFQEQYFDSEIVM